MKGFRIFGKICEAESGRGISGLNVEILDADLFADDLLKTVATESDGSYEAVFPASALFRERPDVYLNVKTQNGKLIASTRNRLKTDVDSDTEINVGIPGPVRMASGLEKEILTDKPAPSGRLKTWKFISEEPRQSPLRKQIEADLQNKSSIVELLQHYMSELYLNPDNNALPYEKIMEIFRRGVTPEVLEGHVYGIWLSFRTGDQKEPFAAVGNVFQVLLGTTLDEQCPWAGKTFVPLDKQQIEFFTEGAMKTGQKVFRVINHFRKMDMKPANNFSFDAFNLWLNLDDASPEEQNKFGHQKNGGYMIGATGRSVYPKTDREVLILNYRWKNLANKPPLAWLVDEVVEIAEGLCLGQILCATKRLLAPYDPARPPSDYAYQPIGYFLIFAESWNEEAQRLFPFLEIPL